MLFYSSAYGFFESIAGVVSIVKSGVEIARQENGGVLGEMGILTAQPRSATVRSVTGISGIVYRVGVGVKKKRDFVLLEG